MRNRRAILSILASLSLLTVTLLACEDEKPSEFTDPALDGGNLRDANGTFNTDGAAQPDAGTVVKCDPRLPTDFKKPDFEAPKVEKACTAAEIGSYFDACLSPAKNGLKNQDCIDFITKAPDCVACAEREDHTGPVQAYRERVYFNQNYPGCVAIKMVEKGGTIECASAFNAQEECLRAACDNCFDETGATYDNFTACKTAARTTSCKTYVTGFETACKPPSYKQDPNGAPECFGTGTDLQATKDFYTKLITVTCGGK